VASGLVGVRDAHGDRYPHVGVGVVYKLGLAGLWYTFFPAWCSVSAFVSAKIFRRSLAYTQAELQSIRFGGMSSELLRGWVAGWQVFLNMFILGWVGIAMGKVCLFVFGWPLWVGLILFSAICAIYVLAAGYWGVVMADFQQGVIAFIAILIVSLWGVHAAGGPGGIVSKLHDLGAAGKLNPFAFTGFTGAISPSPGSSRWSSSPSSEESAWRRRSIGSRRRSGYNRPAR